MTHFYLFVVTAFWLTLSAHTHCGPKDVDSWRLEGVIEQLAIEVSNSASAIFGDGRNNVIISQKDAHRMMDIGSLLKETFEERSRLMATLLAEIKNSTVNAQVEFAAKYETARIEHWARIFVQLELNPTEMLKKSVNVPFEKTEDWRHSDEVDRKDMIVNLYKSALCL